MPSWNRGQGLPVSRKKPEAAADFCGASSAKNERVRIFSAAVLDSGLPSVTCRRFCEGKLGRIPGRRLSANGFSTNKAAGRQTEVLELHPAFGERKRKGAEVRSPHSFTVRIDGLDPATLAAPGPTGSPSFDLYGIVKTANRLKCGAMLKLPPYGSPLANLYWMLRYKRRSSAARRRYYRYISDEKKRLFLQGAYSGEAGQRFHAKLDRHSRASWTVGA